MPISARRKAVLVKLETTYGTDATPTAAADGVLCKTVSPTDPLKQQTKDRELIRPFFGQFQSLTGGDFAEITIEMEAAGFGTAGPAAPTAGYDALMQICGQSRTVTTGTSVVYAPASTSLPSATVYYYAEGAIHKLTGCRGNMELSLDVNAIPYFKFTLWGQYQPVVDGALVTPTLTAYQVPLLANSDNTPAISIQGYSAQVQSLSFKLNNQLEMRELIGGSRQVLIVDRKPDGHVVMELPLVAAKNYWTNIAAGTLGAFSFTHGTTAGNKVGLSSAAGLQLLNAKLSENQNIVHLEADLRFVPSAAGGDEYALTIS